MCTALVAVTTNFAQLSPLQITGTVAGVSVAGPPVIKDAKPIYKNGLYEREYDLYTIGGRLTLHNRSDETIIVPNPMLFDGPKTKIRFLNIPSRESTIVDSTEGFLPGEPSYWSTRFSHELSRAEPAPNYFFVIEPRGFRETGLFVHVKGGYCTAILRNMDERGRDVEVALATYPYLRIEFSTGDSLAEAALDARRRWSRIGNLVLTNGSFQFESDVIINQQLSPSETYYTPNCRK